MIELCPNCKQLPADENLQLNTIEYEHGLMPKWRCPHCGYVFPDAAFLRMIDQQVAVSGMPIYVTRTDGTAALARVPHRAAALHIPDEIDGIPVTTIMERACSCCKDLIEITIPDSMRYIAPEAFDLCVSLKHIVLPSALEFIPDGLFLGCHQLEEVVIPDKATVIRNDAFMDCENLKSVKLHEKIDRIGCGVFHGCKSLQSIHLPDGLISIGHNPFSDCLNLIIYVNPGTEAEKRCIERNFPYQYEHQQQCDD